MIKVAACIFKIIFVCIFFWSFENQASSSQKNYLAFKLSEDRMLYRRPLLASGPAEGLMSALPRETELLVVYETRNKEWVFVRSDMNIEGWIPSGWIQQTYAINPVDVRTRFYPPEPEPEISYELNTDVRMWGDEILLKKLNK